MDTLNMFMDDRTVSCSGLHAPLEEHTQRRFPLWVKATDQSKWINQTIIGDLKSRGVEITRTTGLFAMLNTTEEGKKYLQQLDWVKIPYLDVKNYTFNMIDGL